MVITEFIRNKILSHLPDDYVKRCEKETGFSASLIYKVLHKGHDNDAVSEWLVRTAAAEKQRKDEKAKELTLIAKQL